MGVRGIGRRGRRAGGRACLVAAGRIKRSSGQGGRGQIIGNMLWSARVTGFQALGAVALLPLVAPEPTRGMEIGVVIFVCVFGVKGMDVVLCRFMGLSVVDLMEPADINDIRRGMSPRQQEEHARNCPFRCGDCRRR